MKPILVCLLLVAAAARGEVLTIRNAALEARYDSASSRVSILAQGRVVLDDVQLPGASGPAKIVTLDVQRFGPGQALVWDGGQIALHQALPFALVQTAVRNTSAEPLDIRTIKTFSACAELGVPVTQLKTIGTGGLQEVDKNTGSYAWLALAEPQSRSGLVAGWLTHDRGSGVVFSPVTNGQVRLEAQIDYGRLRLKPGATEKLETLAIGWFSDARLGLEAWADAVAKQYAIKLPPQPAGFCTWYTEKYSGACDAQHLAELAAYAAKELKPFGFEFVQIDDHWQAGKSKNGPCRDFMKVKENGPYPNGMQPTAEAIAKLGLTPGIWFMPFAGTPQDGIFLEHPEWFYHDKDGKPFEARWGGGCLDMSVPAVRDYLRGLVKRIAHEWGYTLFKMDGLWTGTGTRLMYVNNGYKWDEMGEALPADPNKTQIENYRDGLKLVREAAGPKVFLLGCCVSQNMRSFGGAFGLLDAMRVGPDTGAGHIGAPHASRNYFLNGRVWWNDPDCVSVRVKTPLDQARVNASFTALIGALFYNSDWIPDLPAERLDILKRTLAAHGRAARPVDYFENDPARIWLLPAQDRNVVAFFNWGKSPLAVTCAVERLGLPADAEYVAFDFWKNKFLPSFRGELKANLPPGSCRVFALRSVAAHPQLISTSRHITQGIVDMVAEKWDGTPMTLSGTSRVVANDPYELRAVVPVGANSWRALTPATQDGPNVRLVFTNATSADVPWQIKFERGPVQPAAPMVEEALPATPTVVVPKERPPTPPAPQISLFELKPVTAKNGHGKLGINKSNEGKPLTVEGKVYARGLGAHANALFIYKIPAGAKRFVAVIGLDDEKKDDERSSVTFEVFGDVKEMGEEPELLAKSPVLSSKTVRAWAFNVELNERHKELRLVIGDAGDGIASDHADIVAAGFLK
jgi:hypothetical protein